MSDFEIVPLILQNETFLIDFQPLLRSLKEREKKVTREQF